MQEVAVVVPVGGGLAHLVQRAEEYVEMSVAENTRRAYSSDWHQFAEWCSARSVAPMPATPETLAAFLADLAVTHRPSSIQRKVASISVAHQAAGYETPTHAPAVRRTLQGIKREHGVRKDKKLPLNAALLRRMVDRLPEGILGVRDRALLLLGYAGAFRRGELVGLDVSDIEFHDPGILIHVRRSKTDQTGEGRTKGIGYGQAADTCPVRSVKMWLDIAGVVEGAVFRAVNRHGQVQQGRLSDKTVALIVKRAAATVGLPTEEVAGHSLRSGFITDAHLAGVSQARIMAQSGHTNPAQLLDYCQVRDLLGENVTQRVGL